MHELSSLYLKMKINRNLKKKKREREIEKKKSFLTSLSLDAFISGFNLVLYGLILYFLFYGTLSMYKMHR